SWGSGSAASRRLTAVFAKSGTGPAPPAPRSGRGPAGGAGRFSPSRPAGSALCLPGAEQLRQVLLDPPVRLVEMAVQPLPAAELRGVEVAAALVDHRWHVGMEELVVDHRLDDVPRHPRLVEHAVEADQVVLIGVAAELQAGRSGAPPAGLGHSRAAPPGDVDPQAAVEVA